MFDGQTARAGMLPRTFPRHHGRGKCDAEWLRLATVDFAKLPQERQVLCRAAVAMSAQAAAGERHLRVTADSAADLGRPAVHRRTARWPVRGPASASPSHLS